MIIRFVVKNIFSFGEEKEFSTIPNKRLKTLKHHLYRYNDLEILKLCSFYGANGAGKSNLVKALSLFQDLVTEEKTASHICKNAFKFDSQDNKKSTVMAIEFIKDQTPYYYGIEVQNNRIKTEELYISGLGKKDELLFERKTNDNNETKLTFFKDFEKDKKNIMLKEIIVEEFIEPEKTILKAISKKKSEAFRSIKPAYNWFEDTLQIIFPDMKPAALSERIEQDEPFKKYAENLMNSFDVGINSFTTTREEFVPSMVSNNKQYEELIDKIETSPNKIIGLMDERGRELILKKEEDTIWLKQLHCCHHGICESPVNFSLDEESDGTIRLLDFIPAFYNLIKSEKVYIIDEIERSIHPLLIRELIKKFSLDDKTMGQLIFTTHESNLLDQDIFRQDEIWFSEKDPNGVTDLYSLDDFKTHKTIDIRKGYLTGKYGSIPFLGNLSELNWH